jgi:ABC-type Zn uptake system ZnuABC Zn-binding protein ZnuA/ABC-type Mn2+/Zn2+ transport system permease subunit
MLEPFQLPFVQRGLIEVLLLSVAGGLLGSWIVLRGLAFYSHAVGTAAFPGLVLADGLGFAAPLGALGAAVVFTVATFGLSRSRRAGYDSATALVLVGCLALGVILASDVFDSGANVDFLLFGSLLLIDSGDIALAGAASALALLATLAFGDRWLARGFEGEEAALRTGANRLDAMLLGLVALAITAALTAVGALLVTALFVVPAATVRLVTRRVPQLLLGSVALTAIEGTVGLWLAVKTDAPPGATIAVLGGACFVAALAIRGVLRRPRAALAASAAIGAIALVGCGGSDGDGDRVQVVATTPVLADFAREVGGKRVDVEGLMEPGTDPHEYEPRPSDVEATAGAEIFFRSGGDVDDWSEEVISDSGSDAELVDLSEGLPVTLHGHEHGEEEIDPHWWHDPRDAIAAVRQIRTGLAAADPQSAREFSANADRYVAQLRTLDAGIRSCVAAIAAGDRKLVTDHDALGYFARRYRFEVVGSVIPATTTQAQPSAGELAELADTVSREQVPAVFPESSVNNRLAEAIADRTGASADYVLYGDTLGADDSEAATYLSMEQANADAITRGLTDGRRRCRIAGVE